MIGSDRPDEAKTEANVAAAWARDGDPYPVIARLSVCVQRDGLIDDDGKKPKEAFDEVKTLRDCSPRTVRRAIKQYGKPRRKRRQA
jgi:hypothetical protein